MSAFNREDSVTGGAFLCALLFFSRLSLMRFCAALPIVYSSGSIGATGGGTRGAGAAAAGTTAGGPAVVLVDLLLLLVLVDLVVVRT